MVMIVEYHKHNQVVAPILVAKIHMTSSLEQINTASGTQYVAIDLVNMFFSTLCQ